MIKTLYMVRHGHYIMDKKDPSQEDKHISILSVTGLETIIKLGKKLREKDHHINRIVYSPLRRTYETALLLKKILHVEMFPAENIVEAFYEEGNIEHLENVYYKFRNTVDDTLDQNEDSIIVSHRLPISLYLRIQLGNPFNTLSKHHELFKLLKMGDCVKCKFNKDGRSYKLISYEHFPS